MKRRDFLQKTILTGTSLAFSSSLFGKQIVNQKSHKAKITILHTNDTHSNIDAFPMNHAKHPGLGGVSKRFELIQKIRSEVEHVILLDAGDIFQGTPYFNRYGGELEMKVMTKMGYDIATMGNHDFDGGMEGFIKAKKHAVFPFVCSNYDFKNTPIDGQTLKYSIINKGGFKIGVFGLGVELKNLVPDKLYGETKYLNPIEIAQEYVKLLRHEKCDLIICLSHLGYEYETTKISDRVLAKSTKGIDLIIGGHTHTFLEKPTQEFNLDGNITLINQVGWAGVNLGRIDFDLEKKHFIQNRTIIVS